MITCIIQKDVKMNKIHREPDVSPSLGSGDITLNNINNPHDKYVRALMQDPKIASEFFTVYADEDIKKHMDLTAIELQKTSFITDDLKEYFSDLVF